MRFNINDYDATYVMHCKTEEEVEIFLNYLDGMGMTWPSGRRYTEDTKWDILKEKTAYRFLAGAFDDIDVYKDKGASQVFGFVPQILTFDEFEWEGWNDEIIYKEVDIPFESIL